MERRRRYDQAKHDTRRQCAHTKMSLLSYERYARLRTDTTVVHTHHTQQALYTWLQQEHIIQMAQETAKNYRLTATLYWEASKQAPQTLYFIGKRPREQSDPTLWEVPLQPLPKRQKAHWDPNKREIPLT